MKWTHVTRLAKIKKDTVTKENEGIGRDKAMI